MDKKNEQITILLYPSQPQRQIQYKLEFLTSCQSESVWLSNRLEPPPLFESTSIFEITRTVPDSEH